MHRRQIQEVRIATEQMVLSALCQASGNAAREFAFRWLKNYHWRHPDHGVVFEALVEIGSRGHEVIRERLPSALTRKGFPDIEWETLFKRMTFSSEQLEGWIHTLLESAAAEESV
jgi:hypothetical protein